MKLAIAALCAGCSFSPGTAPSDGQRDGTTARPDSRGDTIDAAPDAKPFLDAPAQSFDPAQCPATYTNNTITSSPNSRYRILGGQQHGFATQYATCNADHPGWTHLVTLSSTDEADQIEAGLDGNQFYVGAVQPADRATPATGWLGFDGQPVPAELWQDDQPNDNADGVENNDQNVAAVDNRSGRLNDVGGSYQFFAVCECDGIAVPQAVADAIADLRRVSEPTAEPQAPRSSSR